MNRNMSGRYTAISMLCHAYLPTKMYECAKVISPYYRLLGDKTVGIKALCCLVCPQGILRPKRELSYKKRLMGFSFKTQKGPGAFA